MDYWRRFKEEIIDWITWRGQLRKLRDRVQVSDQMIAHQSVKLIKCQAAGSAKEEIIGALTQEMRLLKQKANAAEK